MTWLKDNFGWSVTTADRYMRVANAWGKLGSLHNLEFEITGEAWGKLPLGGNLTEINIDASALAQGELRMVGRHSTEIYTCGGSLLKYKGAFAFGLQHHRRSPLPTLRACRARETLTKT